MEHTHMEKEIPECRPKTVARRAILFRAIIPSGIEAWNLNIHIFPKVVMVSLVRQLEKWLWL